MEYKKHVEVTHRNYLCELCLKNRHCVLADLTIFESKADLNKHLNGKYADSYMNHQKCQFCGTYHDDVDALQRHYRDEHRICEFCKGKRKKDSDYVFADYRQFMHHAKQLHLICGTGGCDCVFKNVTDLDIHQAEYHKKKVSLRLATKEEGDDDEEDKKQVPTITAEQYERMNKDRKNEHFPTLSGNKVYQPGENAKVEPQRNKRKNNKKNSPG